MKALVSCVAEADDRWADMVALLANSVRRFGGKISESPFVANFVGEVSEPARKRLDALNVTLRKVERFDVRCPWANKLRMLELCGYYDFDVLVALDCDVGVMGDISPYLSRDHLRALVERASFTFSDEQWASVFAHFHLDVRKNTVDSMGRQEWPYFNTGVLFIPSAECSHLLEQWRASLDRVYSLFQDRPDLAHRRDYADQIAFAVAVQWGRFEVNPLPFNLNCQTGGVSRLLEPDAPVILHYHRNLDRRGFIRRSSISSIVNDIEKFNKERARVLDVPYPRLSRRTIGKWMLQRSRLTNRVWRGASAIKQGIR
jgi:hypothetical protein